VVVAQANQPAPQPTVDRFKQRYGSSLVDSKKAPEWLSQGAGCALGQMTAMEDGQATVVPAHLCVGVQSASSVTNRTCEAAEAQAWSGLAKLFGVTKGVQIRDQKLTFGGQTMVIQGARIDATWRGSFADSSVCALQLAWPVKEFERLETSWEERGNQAQKLYQEAIQSQGSAGDRCEKLKRSSELLNSIPGNRRLTGKVENSNLLSDLVLQTIGTQCTSEKTLVLGLHCTMDDQDKPCSTRLRSGLAHALNQAGWKIVGTDLSGPVLAKVMRGDQEVLRHESAQQAARYMAMAKVSVEKVGQRGKIMFCRANMDFRLLDSRSGSASKTFEHSAKTGGLTTKQCFKNSSVNLGKKIVKPLTQALKASP
jgi:hypothetical protein